MLRQIAALLTTCIAAPYLTVLFVFVGDRVIKGKLGIDALSKLGMVTFTLGTFGLLSVGLHLLFIASILALILHFSRSKAHGHAALVAGLFGMCFAALVLSNAWGSTSIPLIGGGFAGAICGWIYWAIAIKRTPDRAYDVDAE